MVWFVLGSVHIKMDVHSLNRQNKVFGINLIRSEVAYVAEVALWVD